MVVVVFTKNNLKKMYERLNVFILVVHCACVIPMYIGVFEIVEVQSNIFEGIPLRRRACYHQGLVAENCSVYPFQVQQTLGETNPYFCLDLDPVLRMYGVVSMQIRIHVCGRPPIIGGRLSSSVGLISL